jgi:carboxyl-terminal processing protease
MNLAKNKIIFSILIGLILGIIAIPTTNSKENNIYEELEKFRYVYNMAFRNYVDSVDTKKLTEAAIRGMLKELDPHSVYIDADEMKQVEEDFAGSFEGIGVQFDILNDTIVVIAPITDGPSEKLGIQAGDKIVKIDHQNAVGIKRDDVPKKLKGAKGTHVILDIKRSGDKNLIQFDIIRDKIPIYTVDASFIIDNSDIGVVAVNRFAATTHKELMDAVEKLKAKGMKRLILDLRGNPGGFLDQAYLMADEFIRKGDTIVYTKSRISAFDEVKLATEGGELEDIPIIVLVNAGSASASEIVSGAIQDLDRGLIVGETSFGKGLVQRQYPLMDGSAFRLTISRYYTPSGRCIQRPYDDPINYRRLVGRLELEEGSNLEHSLDKIKKEQASEKDTTKKINLDSIPLYYTRGGRTLLGGGGIIPDYIIKTDTITRFSAELRRKRIFYEFINNNLMAGRDVKEKYKDNFDRFYKEFKITDDMMKDLRKLAESKEIKWNEESAKIDDQFIKIELKSQLARQIWGRNEYMMVFSDIDDQIQKAKNLFPEAEKIHKMKKR